MVGCQHTSVAGKYILLNNGLYPLIGGRLKVLFCKWFMLVTPVKYLNIGFRLSKKKPTPKNGAGHGTRVLAIVLTIIKLFD